MSQLPTQYLKEMKQSMLAYQDIRRDVIKQSGDALHQAKKSIFALHRADTETARTHLHAAEEILSSLIRTHKKTPEFQQEGSFRAAVEEFVEATLFMQCVSGKPLKKITSIPVPDDVYVAGLADVPGELYRYTLSQGTEHNVPEVLRIKAIAEDIVESLIEFDLTKQLRSKFDQAKSALHKIEHVVYELSV